MVRAPKLASEIVKRQEEKSNENIPDEFEEYGEVVEGQLALDDFFEMSVQSTTEEPDEVVDQWEPDPNQESFQLFPGVDDNEIEKQTDETTFELKDTSFL